MKGLRILELRASMFKGIEAVEIKPTNPIVMIEGPNGSGKTSILDVIESIRGTKYMPEQPVKLGAQFAKNELVIGDDKPEIIITREIYPDKPARIKVTRADGTKYQKPQQMLDDLASGIAFDPMEFIGLKPLARVEMLRRALGLDFQEEDALLEKLEIERTEAFQRKKGAEYSLSKYEHYQPVSVGSIDEVHRRRLEAMAFNNNIDRKRINLEELEDRGEISRQDMIDVENKLYDKKKELSSLEARIVELKLEISDINFNIEERKEEIEEISGEIESARKEISEGPAKKDLSVYDQEIQRHGELKAQAERYNIKVDFEKNLKIATDEWAEKEQAISKIRLQKRIKIAAAKMPLEGLDFDSTGTITLKGVDISQINTASQLEVAVHVCIALDSKLKVIRIKNGSMIDSEGMKKLEKIAFENNRQIWIEKVQDNKTSTDTFFISEGRVKA